MEKQPLWWTPLKYFLHGISFSVLLFVLGFVWILILTVLVIAGFIIGFIIGLVVLFIFVGGLNSFLADIFWDISTETGWKSLLGHGFILFVALLIADIPAIIIGFVAPGLATTIVLFIIYAFISGFIAKNVAGYWERQYGESLQE